MTLTASPMQTDILTHTPSGVVVLTQTPDPDHVPFVSVETHDGREWMTADELRTLANELDLIQRNA